ncbi:citryl-CoA lyase [Amycolatopsis endophytica]|uniref:citrate synthase (unknown stereospecificity) n=1 Tax=Amycolatopsis endophytica TaxID=860233 RepID=A0A853BD72_9PSEU|nr:citryl-CoA lyase [Amycolatopsis endophytica]NYI92376.1 citrate synthase [Amycolatopsis endophytica]
MPASDPVRSDIAWSSADTVVVHGKNLCEEVLGTVNLGDFAYLELFGRLPDPDQSVVFNALVVALVEHGLTPSALVTRLTHLGAPESLQGAVAAGLLGLGTTFVGTMEGAARYCAEAAATDTAWRTDDAALEKVADGIVASFLDRRAAVPGIGHPVHKPLDPRAEKLFAIARGHGIDPANERLVRAVRVAAEARTGKVLPVNVTGAIGAVATAMEVPLHVVRGLGVMARAIGLVGHLVEEGNQPVAGHIWREAEERATRR